MKKRLGLLLAAVLLLASLAGCGQTTGMEGFYVTKTINGQTPAAYYGAIAEQAGVDFSERLAELGLSEDALNRFITLQLNADGTGALGSVGSDPEPCTWEEQDGAVVVTYQDAPQTFAVNGAELSASFGGLDLVLERTE